ncbi:MAG: hypothetical protein EOO38_23490 [Cytophagaceae bacterium]|nr:MAG: hypothetical protein EOO38_23490 [Cytophagaceae bacterium]
MLTQLSSLHQSILSILLEEHDRYGAWNEEHVAAHPEEEGWFIRYRRWGVAWYPKKQLASLPLNERVSLPRAVAQLEALGLLIRQNQWRGAPDTGQARTTSHSMPPQRYTHILLTSRGFEVARSLCLTLDT